MAPKKQPAPVIKPRTPRYWLVGSHLLSAVIAIAGYRQLPVSQPPRQDTLKDLDTRLDLLIKRLEAAGGK